MNGLFMGGDRKLEGLTLEDFVHGAEKFYLERLLKSQKGLISKTADVAGISPKSLYVKMKKHNLKKRSLQGRIKNLTKTTESYQNYRFLSH
ncbi:MAG: hypothetical protein JRJ79_15555 [Deltaproteobacteria bacterium]|nr:hypothetical protein [Deltaproteobacteria bacterium]